MPERLDQEQMAQRVAAEFRAGEVVALGSGLPSLVPGVTSSASGVQYLSDTGALGYKSGTSGNFINSDGGSVSLGIGGAVVSSMELSGMLRGGKVPAAVVQAAQVSATGDFVHWSTAQTPGVLAPGSAVNLGSGPQRVIAMLAHTQAEGASQVLAECSLPLDGRGCVNTIITDLAVMRVEEGRLRLTELAPGWTAEEVKSLTDAPLEVAPNLKEMSFEIPESHPPQKVCPSGLEAVSDLPDGAVVMIDGFAGPGGMPHYLLVSLRDHGAKNLTIISNTAGIARVINFGTPPGKMVIDHSLLIENNQVKKAIASYPVSPSASRPSAFELAYRRGEVELELVPQGTLAERLRAGGAGVAAFYTPTGAGTRIAEGKESRVIDGKEYVLERGLKADFCLIRGHQADTLGNVVYKGTSRNFNAVMAPAARVTVVEVNEIMEPGQLDPETIVTPGVYVDRVVKRPDDFSPYE
ncbi:MAG: 3-oxoacid CoA-transferase subunit A [Dehalococcoidia bacterium]